MQTSTSDQAETLIRATGARVTRQRVTVLEFLMGQEKSLTHHDIQALLSDEALDSVTLYRVLEWLTENELVHRIAGADQVWRFSASSSAGSGQQDHDHAHFQCTNCDSVTCFNDMPLPKRKKMPDGFTSQEVEFLIKGICPRCGEH